MKFHSSEMFNRYFVYFIGFTKLSRWNNVFPEFYPVFGYMVREKCITELEDTFLSRMIG